MSISCVITITVSFAITITVSFAITITVSYAITITTSKADLHKEQQQKTVSKCPKLACAIDRRFGGRGIIGTVAAIAETQDQIKYRST
jgi:uncharacterized membrane protein